MSTIAFEAELAHLLATFCVELEKMTTPAPLTNSKLDSICAEIESGYITAVA